MASNFWLYKWIDEHEIDSTQKAIAALDSNSQAMHRLLDIITEDQEVVYFENQFPGIGIAAERGLDLSGDLDCCGDVDRKAEIDQLFSRAIHYFDHILVSGPRSHTVMRMFEHGNPDVMVTLIRHIEGLLYLREIGAEDLVQFAQKPNACPCHFAEAAQEADLTHLTREASPVVDQLAREGKVHRLTSHADHWHYEFRHPLLEHDLRQSIDTKRGKKPTKKQIATDVYRTYAANLVSDIAAARAAGFPLGSSRALHHQALQGIGGEVTLEDVALQISLPVFERMPIRDIISFRQDEWEHYEQFRHALTKALAEKLKNPTDSERMAREIERDFIEPALHEIDRKLRVARSAISKKAGVSVDIGALVTAVGAITASPMILGAGLAAVATSIPGIHKYFDDKGTIEVSDMYFLWALQQRHGKHGKPSHSAALRH